MLNKSTPGTMAWALNEFDFFDGTYKREAMDFAIQHREEITPNLLEILENAVARPKDFLPPCYGKDHKKESVAHQCKEGHNTWSHIYAVTLLSHFREKRAHDLIAKLFSMNEDLCNALWGDMITEDLPALLYSTYPGSPETIKKLLLDKTVYDFVRTSAADALAYCVAGDLLDRSEVLEFLGGLFTGTEADPSSPFWAHMVCVMLDIHPDKLQVEIARKAFARGLIDEGLIDRKLFEKEVRYSVKSCMAKLKEEIARRLPSEVHRRLESWASFKKDDRREHQQKDMGSFGDPGTPTLQSQSKIGRNDPCPCGSGKKFKKCCLE